MATQNTETKTETKTTAAPPFPGFPSFPAFDPMAMFAATQQSWQKLMADAGSRSQAFADQFVAMEGQLIARAHEAINTWAQLAHDALTYSTQLSAEARKLGLDAAKKMGPQA